MFFGQYEHSIDDKGRLTIPARFRVLMEQQGAYITQGFEKNLIVLPLPVFEQISTRLNQMSMTDQLARQLKRLFFANAAQVEIDRVGRILIPSFLRQSINMDSAVMAVGVGAYFEIWSLDEWKKQNIDLQDPEANAQKFANFDLPI